MSINIYTEIGILTLCGLLCKHGILLVKNTNSLLSSLNIDEALLTAAVLRLRPITMTTMAMALGVLPLLFASGGGAAARFSLGILLLVGIVTGTLGALFMVPVLYRVCYALYA